MLARRTPDASDRASHSCLSVSNLLSVPDALIRLKFVE
jgi:hypothetical protein